MFSFNEKWATKNTHKTDVELRAKTPCLSDSQNLKFKEHLLTNHWQTVSKANDMHSGQSELRSSLHNNAKT